jgi:hypothetical protein
MLMGNMTRAMAATTHQRRARSDGRNEGMRRVLPPRRQTCRTANRSGVCAKVRAWTAGTR